MLMSHLMVTKRQHFSNASHHHLKHGLRQDQDYIAIIVR